MVNQETKQPPFVVKLSARAGYWTASCGSRKATAPWKLVRHGRGLGVTDIGKSQALAALRVAYPELDARGFTVKELQ